ncbi:protein FAM216B [Pelodiscus sinensis]|uniref:protein FAM216B n=1 Tax=Pelodiscus sinensis TaxID=13735 RepID=UPI000D722111|nr:protein FAM216B [Pelodiscus sinensis]|eukprot:XP_025041073.1 protein FAM216B [Pelodiscus sinensis]
MGENWKRNPSPHRSPKVSCVQVPPSAQDTYLLKDLKRGQKCYLYSIMRVYDSKPLREMLSHRYRLNLQHQNLLGYITEHEVRSYVSFLDEAAEKGEGTTSARNSTSLKSRAGRTQLALTGCSS